MAQRAISDILDNIEELAHEVEDKKSKLQLLDLVLEGREKLGDIRVELGG